MLAYLLGDRLLALVSSYLFSGDGITNHLPTS